MGETGERVNRPAGRRRGEGHTISAELAAMLAAARRRKRWSYRQAAGRIHVVPSMLFGLEQGTRAPSTVTAEAIIDAYGLGPVGFQNSATRLDLGFYAARSYSLRRPPRTGLRLIRFWERPATGKSGRGGRSWRLRWGRRPL